MDRFTVGRLTVMSFAGRGHHNSFLWLCICECGNKTTVAGHLLRRGQVKSCGCLKADTGRATLEKFRASGGHSNLQHGDARAGAETPEWRTWHSIKRRCNKKFAKQYPDYAGRGIKMCKRWESSYEKFLADVGRRPGPEYSLDRINNDGDYKPNNVRWATRKEQARNRRNSFYITLGKSRLTLSEWSERTGLQNTTIRQRLLRGWSVKKALGTR